jgi:TonB family protein
VARPRSSRPMNDPSPSRAVVGDIVTAPVRIRTVSPDYPAAARAAQLEGDVLLEALIGTDGKVKDVALLRSVHPLVDEAAKKAVRQYEYTPGRRNGAPESVAIRVTVSFRLR